MTYHTTNRLTCRLAAIAVVGAITTVAAASPMTILNPSFETPALGAGNASYIANGTSGFDWLSRGGYYGGAGICTETVGSTPATPAGDQWAILNVDETYGGDGGFGGEFGGDGQPDTDLYLWQQVGTVDANGQYTINYLLGLRDSPVFPVGSLGVSIWAGGTAPFAGDGATLLDSDTAGSLPAPNTTVSGSSVLFAGLSNVGQTLWLRFQVTSDFVADDGGFGQLLLDDVSGDMVQTPEPASIGLLLLGGAAMLRRSRRTAK